MIKEKKKNNKYNFKKTKKQLLKEYLRTVFCSVIFAIIFTSCLALHARNEMIKNLYIGDEEQQKLDKELAQQIIAQSNLIKDLQSKNYLICMHVGDLYETAGDYKNAEFAYELAIQKARQGVYKPYYKLICVLVEQEEFAKANDILNNIQDYTNKNLIKFKTRSYIVIGDKYYSIGKFIKAGKSYEKADFYYNKFSRKDSVIDASIKKRIINSYIQAADIMVKTGMNTDAVRYLQKAEKYNPEDFQVRYKLAIVLSDLNPEKSVAYFDKLLKEIPQDIDYGVYNNALLKSANIADLDNRPAEAKYYRYKIHSIDMFVNRKVIYKNDIEIALKSFIAKKVFFTYPLKAVYQFSNISHTDIINLKGDFVLTVDDKPVETITKIISDKNSPLYSNSESQNEVNIKFKKKIFTKKELSNYKVKIYLYKDDKFKTLAGENSIPHK